MPEPEIVLTLRPAVDRPGTVFEGFGTALAWFANVTGGWPDAEKNRLADLFYGKDGLGWTIARYNIGGGNPDGTPLYLRPGAAVPGFWRQPPGATGTDWWRPDEPEMWDWSQDANQRWWLDAVRERVASPTFEAFSNSPPWFMTISGRVSGSVKPTDDNLRPGQEGAFAAYLARVVDEMQQRHHIVFRTLSPLNEPSTDYWFAANRQEGSHWQPARQAMMIEAAASALQARGLRAVVAAPDETSSHLFLTDWASYPASTRAVIGQINVHSYDTVHQTGVRDVARASGVTLWMSEDDAPLAKDPENFDGIASALAFGEHVVHDFKRLEPSAWVFWQAVEDISARDGLRGSNWGLVKTDLRAPADAHHMIYVTAKYWAMASFSRYIRPGMRLVPVDDEDTIAAMTSDGGKVVIVHVNGGLSPRRLRIDLGSVRSIDVIVTDSARKTQRIEHFVGQARPEAMAPPRAITTLEVVRNIRPAMTAKR